jgi:hypothetical protein
LFLFSSNQAIARLGESEIAIEKRFGEPQRSLPQDANLPKKLQERVSCIAPSAHYLSQPYLKSAGVWIN